MPKEEHLRPDEIVGRKLVQQDIREAYRHLSASQAELIEQVYWKGYTLREIAERNREPLGTVKSRLHQALKVLRRELTGWKEEACDAK